MLTPQGRLQTFGLESLSPFLAVETQSRIVPKKPFETLKKCNVARRRNLLMREQAEK